MVQLTKKDILLGINNPQLKTINNLNGELWLRPLSGAELDEIDYIEAEGLGNLEQNAKGMAKSGYAQKVSQNNKINVLKYTKAADNARYTLIYKSLDNPKYSEDPWTMDEVKKLSKPAVEELEKIIKELSGVNVTVSDVKNFPENE